MPQSADALLQDIRLMGEDRYRLMEAVRQLVHRTIKPVREEVKYGGIVFSSGVMFCGVFAYRSHVSLEFGFGARIDDGPGFLEGSGKYRRHLKLRSMDDIPGKQVASYLASALDAARAGV